MTPLSKGEGLTHLSLFSGIGGLDLAAHWAGFTTVGFVEQNPFCQKVLRKNFGAEVPIYDDIRSFDARPFRGVDLVSGGFPCQDISAAGKGAGLIDGERSRLWFDMLRVVRECRPVFLLAENVPALRTKGIDRVLDGLAEAGYAAEPFVVGAGSAGAPHIRKRVFVVGFDLDCFNARQRTWRRRGESHQERIGSEDEPGWLHELAGAVPSTASRGVAADADRMRKLQPQGSESDIRRRTHHGTTALVPWRDREPPVLGMVAGVPRGVDRGERIKALGNAVVPQQAYPILKAIANELLQG